MSIKENILAPDYKTIRPEPDEVSTIMGYSRATEPSFVPEMLSVLLDEATVHVTAHGFYSVLMVKEVKVAQGLILHDSGNLRCGSRIARQISGSDSFALFIATAGSSFDTWVKSKATEGDLLAEYMCSSIGSVIADKVADLVQGEIYNYAVSRGKGITNRYSPGYCSWNIREQHRIFDLLPAEKIGVSLTPSFLMQPVKTISGLIGIGSGMVPGPYMCDLCNMTNCLVKKEAKSGDFA
jgi:hypothetical protein